MSRRRVRRRVWICATVLGVVAVAATLLFAATAFQARDALEEGVRIARQGIAAAKRGDTEQRDRSLRPGTRAAPRRSQRCRRALGHTGARRPCRGPARGALRTLARDAEELVATGAQAARDADVETLRVDNGRIDPSRVEQMREPLARVSEALDRANDDLEDLASPWLLGPVDDAVTKLTRSVRRARVAAETAALGVKVAPELLGADHPTSYFLAFITPSEARGVGGFMGNWGILTIDDGRLELSQFGRTGELNAAGDPGHEADQRTGGLPRPIRAVRPGDRVAQPEHGTRLSDRRAGDPRGLPESGRAPIDGVIAVDPEGLAALLKLTGPIQVPGRAEPLTSEHGGLPPAGPVRRVRRRAQRIDFLEDAAHVLTDTLTHSSLPGPRTLGKTLGPATRGGHLLPRELRPRGGATVRSHRCGGGARSPARRLRRARDPER